MLTSTIKLCMADEHGILHDPDYPTSNLFRALTLEGKWVYGKLIHNASGDVVALVEQESEEYQKIRKETLCMYWGNLHFTPIYEGDVIHYKIWKDLTERFLIRKSKSNPNRLCMVSLGALNLPSPNEYSPFEPPWKALELRAWKIGNIIDDPSLIPITNEH